MSLTSFEIKLLHYIITIGLMGLFVIISIGFCAIILSVLRGFIKGINDSK